MAPSKDARSQWVKRPVCHPSLPGRLPPAPALNSDQVESGRKGCINKARDSLTAPIRDWVLSRRRLRAAAGRWPWGRADARRPPARRSSGAGPLHRRCCSPALLTGPRRVGEGLQQRGFQRPCAGRPGEPAHGLGWPRLGQLKGWEEAAEALSQHWCIARRLETPTKSAPLPCTPS